MSTMFDQDKEKKILDFWRDNDIFNKSLQLRQKAKRFVWWEGPPTANGLPHIGHFLTRVYKDLYGRYKTMRGFYVLRKAGWDTHGLPVEIEVEKELGFKNKKDIEAYGIGKFNKKARESVWKYKNEWEQMTRRMGFWLDMKHPYITYESSYIEPVWSIIKKIWDKNLLYLAHGVVPFCTRCGTPLSSHEVAQGYKTVTDKSVTVKFLISNSEFLNKFKIQNTKVYILAWTTTPWTLPGNVALAVGKNIKYIVASRDSEKYIVAKDLADKVLGGGYKAEQEMTGKELVGLEYKPLFDIKELKSDKSYKIYDADFVSTTDGTGVVHTAVMYGEDDYNLGTKFGLPKFHTVDEQGKFIHVGHGLDGMYVKDKQTEHLIIEILEQNGNLLKTEEYEHDYPFCWRCGTPLLYYAKKSWFIKMSAVNKELLKNNEKINWFPEHIKEGRFGQWLKEGKDWTFSRERYWGTPLPIWKCEKCLEYRVVGSVEELEKLSIGSGNTYYGMRHGYTTRNEASPTDAIISTDLNKDDYHLTPEGRTGVEKTLQSLKPHGVDIIYASPFKRTQETAQVAARLFHAKVITDDRLVDIHEGVLAEGKHASFIQGRKMIDDKPVDGESWNDVRIRAGNFMQDLESRHKNKKILIVSHQDTIWLINTIAKGLTKEEVAKDTADLDKWIPGRLAKIIWHKIPRDELGELDLHRPYIDDIKLKCQKCGASADKIPDLIDVWFDSGAMPYAQWHWPFENKKMFKEQFPADFIVEAIDQTRGWFYTLLAISTLLEKGAPYKNVMVLGHTLDEKGQKMSKSKGNYVPVMEFMDKYGVDVLRWYFLSSMTIGESKSVIPREIEGKQKGFFGTLGNCIKFYELYGKGESGSFHNIKSKELNLLDRWILSKLNGLIEKVSDDLDKYDPTSAAKAIEKFVVEDLSNWWLRRSRKRKEALGLLRFLLLEISKVIAPFTPFSAEDIHTRMHIGRTYVTTYVTESVHLHDWPKVNKKLIDQELEKRMEEVQNIVTVGLAQRKEKQIKVRQPLRAIHLGLSNEFPKDLEVLMKEELNVKEIVYDNKSQKELVVLNTELDRALIYEGYARELMRQLQDMRKEAKYKVDEEVLGQWHSDDSDLSVAVNKWSEDIKKDVLLKNFENSPKGDKVFDVEKEFEIAAATPHQADPLTAIKKGGGLGAGRGKIWVGVKK